MTVTDDRHRHDRAGRSLVWDQLISLVRRSLRTSARVPQLLMFSLTMPMAMLVLFSQVFRSVADGPGFPPGVSYIDFLTPAMLAVVHRDGRYQRRRRGGDRPHQRPARPLRHACRCRHGSQRSPAPSTRWCSPSLAARSSSRPDGPGVPLPRHGSRRRGRSRRGHGAGCCHERPLRPHRRPSASAGRRAIRRDDDHDAVHVRLGGVRAAEHDAGVDAYRGRARIPSLTPWTRSEAASWAPPPSATRSPRSRPQPSSGQPSPWCRGERGDRGGDGQ